MVLQIILVFAMIGVLGLLLRWAFARDKQAPQCPLPPPRWRTPPEPTGPIGLRRDEAGLGRAQTRFR